MKLSITLFIHVDVVVHRPTFTIFQFFFWKLFDISGEGWWNVEWLDKYEVLPVSWKNHSLLGVTKCELDFTVFFSIELPLTNIFLITSAEFNNAVLFQGEIVRLILSILLPIPVSFDAFNSFTLIFFNDFWIIAREKLSLRDTTKFSFELRNWWWIVHGFDLHHGLLVFVEN